MINIVFDLDDTLYSLLPVFRQTLLDIMPEHTLNVQDFYLAFREEANKLFSDSQSGKISMDTFHRKRAQNAFKRFGLELSDNKADEFHLIYDAYKEKIELDDEAKMVIKTCHDHHIQTGIITNGTSQKQRKTMQCLNIQDYFKEPSLILVSGELGIDKPDPRIFEAWTKESKNTNPTLYIGDSFNHDIIGAQSAGWIPVWYNPFKKSHSPVDFEFIEIESLSSLLSLELIKQILNGN